MSTLSSSEQSAINDFQQAHQQAALQQIVARLTGKSIELLSYDEVLRQLKLTGRSERGVQTIPLAAIIGTVGRCTDFTRSFLPRKGSDERRWANLKAFVEQNSLDVLPPIDVYQVGSTYFVQDGHHRVSIARQLGVEFISAYVTEVHTRVPLTPDADWETLVLNAEHAEFLEYTHLDRLRPQSDFAVSVPGQYAKLEDHIEVHRYFSEVAGDLEIAYEEAVCRWHDEAYLPVVEAIREQDILRGFPDRTATDFYLWIAEHRLTLQHELGWPIPAEAATAALAERFTARSRPLLERASRRVLSAMLPASFKGGPVAGQWRKTAAVRRYSDCLFREILVPIDGTALDWCAFDQAVWLAQQECSQVRGMHVVAAEADRTSDSAQALHAEFERRCQAAGVEGKMIVEAGSWPAKVCERAALADVVVAALDRSEPKLDAEFQTMIRNCTRPVLAVPDRAAKIEWALLAYDGSDKSKEALFVAAYLAEMWHTAITVMTVYERGRINRQALIYAQKYLELHEITAEFVFARGNVAENLLKAVDVYRCDVILIGSYCSPPVVEAFIGGTVDRVLRESTKPVLVCR